MQALKNTLRPFLSSNFTGILVQRAGIKIFPPPEKVKDVEFPERNKLRIMEKVPQYPPSLRPFKMQKRLRLMRGPEPVHNTLLHKQFGIIALGGGRLKYGHFEMIRMTLLRNFEFDDMFAIWRVDPPWQPITKKPQGSRMGGGKGPIDHYVTPVKPDRVIIEVGGNIKFFQVKKVLQDIANKCPFKAMAISQEILDKRAEIQRRNEENNLNPWTWKYIIQNNIGGCHKWISPVDKLWFAKYL
ncbi:PREDICTED: 39S ribosomal protein L16, mitochondrial [Polistes dominula]|uniref:Large ribosomal subunit protein uL16m n=1 Tax=Polistes dominula TaxID=743375 RepID=A0ABM1ILL9_POLDO|nr:PREDICTED: 39S ribosomal protein L16, mitochondrial [Polistes dominula]